MEFKVILSRRVSSEPSWMALDLVSRNKERPVRWLSDEVPAAKSDSLSSIPGIHKAKGEN